MVGVLRFLRRTRRTAYPETLVVQRSTPPPAPLRPWQVSGWRFRTTRFGRRGLDPDEVYAFLARVAGDLAAAYLDLDRSRRDAGRAAGSAGRRNQRDGQRDGQRNSQRYGQRGATRAGLNRSERY